MHAQNPGASPINGAITKDTIHNSLQIDFIKGEVKFSDAVSSKIHQTVEYSHETMLEIGVRLLSHPQIKAAYPQVALPFESAELESIKTGEKTSRLKEYGKTYSSIFGPSDQLGLSNALKRIREKGELNWGGEEGLTVTYKPLARGKHSYQITSPDSISIELCVDLFTTFVRDFVNRSEYPQFSAPYLRRWGEEAFEGVHLRPHIPRKLDKGISLKGEETSQELGVTSNQSILDTSAKLPKAAIPRTQTKSHHITEEVPSDRINQELPTEREKEILQKLEDLTAKQKELDEREKLLHRESVQMEAKKSELTTRESGLATREQSIQERETLLKNRRLPPPIKIEHIGANERSLREREAVLVQAQIDFEEEKKEFEKTRQRQSSVLSNGEDSLRRRKFELEERELKLQPRLDELQQKIDRLSNLEQLKRELDAKEQLLNKLNEELTQREKEFSQTLTISQEEATRLEKIQSMAATHLAREEELNKLQRELEKGKQVLAKEQEELTEQQNSFEQKSKEFLKTQESLNTELEREFQEIEEQREEVERLIEQNLKIEERIGLAIAQHLIRAPSTLMAE